jgi:hypothetical protein
MTKIFPSYASRRPRIDCDRADRSPYSVGLGRNVLRVIEGDARICGCRVRFFTVRTGVVDDQLDPIEYGAPSVLLAAGRRWRA